MTTTTTTTNITLRLALTLTAASPLEVDHFPLEYLRGGQPVPVVSDESPEGEGRRLAMEDMGATLAAMVWGPEDGQRWEVEVATFTSEGEVRLVEPLQVWSTSEGEAELLALGEAWEGLPPSEEGPPPEVWGVRRRLPETEEEVFREVKDYLTSRP